MNEPDVIFSVCFAGVAAAFFAFVLYFLTSRNEPSGFSLVPSTFQEWVGYWFRTLMFVLILAMLFCTQPHIHPSIFSALVVSGFLLFTSSVGFWRSDRGVCIGGFVLSGIALLWLLLFPAICVTREA